MPVELREALQQISEIRGHLARTETFRGYRAISVAGTGLLALATALVQPLLVAQPAAHPVRWALLWVAAAVVSGIIAGSEILYGYLRCGSPHRRATTRIVVGHLAPEIVAGAIVTYTLLDRDLALAPHGHSVSHR